MPAVLYTQELAWSPAIYIKDSPCCRGKYRILPLSMWMVAAHQLTNFLLPHSMWFVTAWEWMYAVSLSQISHFDIVTGHARPTAAACWHIKVYSLPKHKYKLASKPFRLLPEDSQPEYRITSYSCGYIRATFYLKLKQAHLTLPMSTRIALAMCHPNPPSEQQSLQPPWDGM